MAKPELGIKRVCQSCGARYYDFLNTPIVCPSCGAVFDSEAVLKSRRARPLPADDTPKKTPVKKADVAEDQEDDVEEVDEEDEEEDEEAVEPDLLDADNPEPIVEEDGEVAPKLTSPGDLDDDDDEEDLIPADDGDDDDDIDPTIVVGDDPV
ncbi:MAG: TIGR02300 family protein [Alphaproteobacteria bacterium]|nr:TIGR02300 family protein [Alphaproteobacteria bacterium]